MNKKTRVSPLLIVGAAFFCLFIVFTILVKTVDVTYFPTEETTIGFSSLNLTVFQALGTNDLSFEVSEVMGLLILTAPVFFAFLAFSQWVKRKSLLKIDHDLWILFATYALTIAFYALFEIIVINYRPILVNDLIEASYPSSHTLLAIVIGGTSFLEVKNRMKWVWLKVSLMVLLSFLTVAIPMLRLLSGVHWLTDIIAGILLGTSMLFLYQGIRSSFIKDK